ILNIQMAVSTTGTVLSGTVTNAATGKPLLGAAVKVAGITCITDVAGKYAFTTLAPKTYAVMVTADGFVPKSLPAVTVAAGKTTGLEIGLNTTILQGKITGGPTAAPVAGAWVTIKGVGTVTTDAAGSYAFPDIPAGTYSITAAATGFITGAAGGITVTAATPAVANLTLTPRTLSGHVTEAATGAPVAGAKVTAAGKAATTDAAGYYTFQNIPGGIHDVSVASRGFIRTTIPRVAVADGMATTVDVPLKRTVLTGRIVSAGSGVPTVPVAGAKVSITGGATTTTDAAGMFTFSDVPPGTYSLTASRSGFTETITKGFAVKDGVQKTVNVRLAPMAVP
ncbi:MAG TPA: carboxypeptidase-like regulatory domain-containing protein, partial [Verrucomicrobiae bacterium]|nr:carboxypeptidase-like regulatory domain-containing protein [Verrucomicrobiae bacterium]